jgi:hypothetical protein
MARQIKMSGRELGVMRAIGFGLGVSGTELQERTNIAPEDLCDVLNTLLDIGYIEVTSAKQRVTEADYAAENFEINPSYVADLKDVMRR